MSKSGKKNIGAKKNKEQETLKADFENTGNYLRTLRMGKGLSTKDVTKATRISEINIIAIEDQNFSSLPADTFTRGLLNIYADFLGADTKTVIAKFMEERDNTSSQKKRTRHKQSNKILAPKRLAEPTHISSVTMAVVLFLIIIVSFTGYCFYTSWNPFSFLARETEDIQTSMKNILPKDKSPSSTVQEEKIIIVPADTPPQEETISSQPQEQSLEETAVPEGQDAGVQKIQYSVNLLFLKDTGVEIKRDDDETVSQNFKAGDTHALSTESSLTLTFSQPDSADILVNDTTIDFPPLKEGSFTLHIPNDLAKIQPDD